MTLLGRERTHTGNRGSRITLSAEAEELQATGVNSELSGNRLNDLLPLCAQGEFHQEAAVVRQRAVCNAHLSEGEVMEMKSGASQINRKIVRD